MALTPYLAELGSRMGSVLESNDLVALQPKVWVKDGQVGMCVMVVQAGTVRCMGWFYGAGEKRRGGADTCPKGPQGLQDS